MRLSLLALPLILAACPNGGDDKGTDTTDTDDTNTVRTRDDFVNTQDLVVAGNMECFTVGALTTQTPDPSCQASLSLDGTVEDFQSGDAVPEATIQVWADDDIISGTPAVTQANDDGNFSIDAPSCTPFGYGTSTPVEWEETKDTYEVHQVYAYGETSATFNSVSEATSRLIPGLIGVQWDTTTGIIAGAAYDCDDTEIENAQVFIHDAAGNIPATGDIFYFSASGDTNLPTTHASQPDTNTNGLWVALNVPVGTWMVELYGWNGTAYDLLGSTELQIKAGTVTISNVYAGISDGKSYPDSCLAPCGG